MTTACVRKEDARLLMHGMPVSDGDSPVRDLVALDAARWSSSAKPPRIQQPQVWSFGGIGLNLIIAGTSLLVVPPRIFATDADLLTSASTHWLDDARQLTDAACSTVAPAAEAESATPVPERRLHERLLTAPIDALSREALAALGLTKTQMASVLGIERPHFYEWLKGRVTKPSKAGRLRDLLALLHRNGITAQEPLRAHLLTEPLEPGALPLLTQLAGSLTNASLASTLSQAARLNHAISDEAAQRQARMRAAGHQPGSDEEAQAVFDTTMDLTEWDDA